MVEASCEIPTFELARDVVYHSSHLQSSSAQQLMIPLIDGLFLSCGDPLGQCSGDNGWWLQKDNIYIFSFS